MTSEGKIIESNPSYELSVHPFPLGEQVAITPLQECSDSLTLTPFGAAELARQLLHWAVYQEEELAQHYPSFQTTWKPTWKKEVI